MGYSETDIKMKAFEQDASVLPANYIMVRLDGVGFSKVTEKLNCIKPFDSSFADSMADVVKYLMEQVPDIMLGYTQSDEITLVFKRDTEWFNRRPGKMCSVLAGKASGHLSNLLAAAVALDARPIIMPNLDLVEENLVWRIEDSVKNCRNLYAYWGLREQGLSSRAATNKLRGKDKAWMNEFLFKERNLNFNEVPAWQKRGQLLYYVMTNFEGKNKPTGEPVSYQRKKLHIETELPDTRASGPLKYLESVGAIL